MIPTIGSLTRRKAAVVAAPLAVSVLLVACGSSGDDAATDTTAAESVDTVSPDDAETETVETDETDETDDTVTTDTADETDDTDTGDIETVTTDAADETATDVDVAATPVDLAVFFDGAIVGDAVVEDCTLSGGAETQCYRMTVSGYPSSYEVSAFCPRTITDEDGGLWWDGDALYDLNGEFIANLAEIYDDDTWQMFDEDGNVFYTETAEEFDLAARPDVDPSLQNHCVEGQLDWLENGEPITSEVVIPVTPVAADTAAAPQGNQGVTLDGVVIANSAPVDAILGAYTIAAFDDCGAHFNPVDGYHLHGAVGCSEIIGATEGEPTMFGYAMDGYPIHSPFAEGEEPDDLDECNGHTDENGNYHYHANSAEQNQVVECLIGQTVAGAAGGGGGERPEGPPPGQEG